MKKENSKIEKQREELRHTIREAAKLHLIKNSYDKNLIKFEFSVKDTKGKESYKIDLAVLDKKTKEPIIIVNIDHPQFYDDNDDDYDVVNLQAIKFDWQDNHVLSYDGKKFEIIHRILRPHNNTFDFINQLDENEIKELKNLTSQELFKIHREKHNHSYPINAFDFSDKLRDYDIYPSDLTNMLVLKYLDESKNDGKLFRGTNSINEQTIREIFENIESFEEYQKQNDTHFKDCLKYFDTPIGELLRNCSISESNPFELIKLISSFENNFRIHGDNAVSKDIISFISEIQNIEKNSVVLLDNLSFSTIFEHIFVIIEKLGCKLDELDKFVNLSIINKDSSEHLKIKFIFQVLGINTDNIKFDFSELNIETKIDYHISLKPFNQRFSGNQNEHDQINQLQYGNDLSKYEIIDFIHNVKSGTTMSFIVASNILFNESKSARFFRHELLKNVKILAIIQLPIKSLITTSMAPSLIVLKKSSSKISDYNIFMSDIDKIGVDFIFTKKEIIKKYNEFKNKKLIKNETDLGFAVNTNQLKDNWSLFDKKPSQKAITKSLKFSNPVHLKEIAEIIRPSGKHTKLDDIIRIRDIDHLFDLKMIGEKMKSEKISEDKLESSLFESGDILFSISGTIGKTVKILSKIPNVGLSSGLVIIRPDTSKITSDYLKHVLDSNNTRLQLVPKGTAIPFLSTKQIHDIKIDLVKLEKQKIIIKKIQALKNKIADLKITILKYENDIENITTKKT